MAQVLHILRVVFLNYTVCFTLFWTANCFPVEPRIDFSDKPFMGGREVHFS